MVIMSSTVPARTWDSHALAVPPSKRYSFRAQIASAAGKNITSSSAVYFEMMNIDLLHVMASNCVF